MFLQRIFKRSKEPEDKGIQEVAMTWRDHELQRALMYSSLFHVTAELTHICHPNGGKPQEVLETFSNMYDGVQDWYKGGKLKDELKKILETMAPDPVGYAPGEQLPHPRKEKP